MKKPIFIIGCPRSGTTITLNVMAFHEQLSWVSNYVNRFPRKTRLSIINRIFNVPLISKQLYLALTKSDTVWQGKIKKYLPIPVEPWNFWNKYLSNFQWKRGGDIPPRRRTAGDTTSEEVRKVREAIESIQKSHGKDRFLSKYTDFPRMKYLTQAFPDAIFVHIVRDGRAVAASYHNKIESGRFGTWKEREWWIKGWPPEWRNEWRLQFGSPLSFVAFQWKFFVREIFKDARLIPPEQYIEVNYSNIISSPVATFNSIFDFCKLRRSPQVQWYLNNITLENMNYKWQERYSDKDIKELEQIIHEPEFRRLLDN
jgi:hypothetical protein